MGKTPTLNSGYRKGLCSALLLVALPCLVAFEMRPSSDETREAQLIHERELLGADSIHLSAAGARRVDQVNDFVQGYARQALRGAWKSRAGEIAQTILDESNRHGFDPLLVLAVIQNESRFRPEIIGTHGEIGLMQIKPDTAEWIARKAGLEWNGPQTLRDPSMNIRIGAAYLAMLRSKFGSNKDLYLAAYNMGIRNLYRNLQGNQVPMIYAQKTIAHYSRIYIEFIGGGSRPVAARPMARAYAAI